MRYMKIRKIRFLAVAAGVAALLVAGMTPAGAGNELTLSFDTQTWVNSLSGRVVITGTLECPSVQQGAHIEVNVTQPDEPHDHYGWGFVNVECDEAAVRWLIQVDGNEFEAGPAAVEGTASYEIEPTDPERSDTTSLVLCSRIGTLEDDKLVGTNGNDKICGLDGDDEITGRGGNDLIRGADGDDNLVGASGDDVLFGGYGRDRMYGSNGNDKLSGNQNNDYLGGGSGKDTCKGGGGRDRMVSC
jgi:hypothetical protein